MILREISQVFNQKLNWLKDKFKEIKVNFLT